VRRRTQRVLRELLRSEQGIALPMAMLMTVIALGFAAVPILASVNAETGDSRDQGTNSALAAAEAGLSLALLRQNQMKPISEKPCVAEEGGKLALAKAQTSGNETGWCLPVTLTSSSTPAPPPGTAVTYRIRPCYPESTCAISPPICTASTENLVKIVSTGTATVSGRTVARRVASIGCSQQESKTVIEEKTTPPLNVFASGQVIGIDWLIMDNGAQVYAGGAGTNGAVTLTGNANVCGTVRYGTTKSESNGSDDQPDNCPGGKTYVKGTAEYPPVVLPEGIENSSSNSNSRLGPVAPNDPVGRPPNRSGIVTWNSSKRELTLNWDQLTLEGDQPYFLCRLVLAGGSELLMGAGKKIRIFFDSPANCSGLNGASQLQIANGAYVGPDAFGGPGFYFLGSDSNPVSRIELGGGADVSQFVVYAPKSTIVANNGVNVNGAIIGRTLSLGGGADVNRSGPFTPPSPEDFLPSTKTKTETTTVTAKPFARKAFIECSATAPSTSPESGC
jgi:hypothetical protein